MIEADARAGMSDYVEARGMLLPSTEYFQRAVTAAERRNAVTGQLLSMVISPESLAMMDRLRVLGSRGTHESGECLVFASQ